MKPFAEAAEQNREPIRAVLASVLADARRVLEIGSGTGQHAVYFAAAFAHLTWQPSDLAEALPGIRAWCAEAALDNLAEPVVLDVRGDWPDGRFDAVYSANTAHIMDWPAVQAMFAGVGRALNQGGRFCLYGPFHYGGRPTSESNARFDLSLRQRIPGGGVRDFDDLDRLAVAAGLRLEHDHEMPVNNRLLVWRR